MQTTLRTNERPKAMRFVIVNHSYEEFLEELYMRQRGLAEVSFVEQMSAYYATLFGSADFYANAIRELGHDVHEIVCNNSFAQKAWLREASQGPGRPHTLSADKRIRRLVSRGTQHLVRSFLGRSDVVSVESGEAPFDNARAFEVLLAQVKLWRPDVLYNQSVYAFTDDQLRALKAFSGVLVGEHAAMPLPDGIDYRLYDLVVSSFPPTIEWLRLRGVRAELVRLAFDPRVAAQIPPVPRKVRISFAGSFLPVHISRLRLVEAVAAEWTDMAVHGTVNVELPQSSPLAGRIAPALWGRDMYQLLRRSVITLNHHGDVPSFANNMRLYEATGMGCLLVTDYKGNLGEMFEPDREVVAYHDAEDCCEKLRFYLDERNCAARERIMAAGHKRTLAEHTYGARMQRLVELIRTI